MGKSCLATAPAVVAALLAGSAGYAQAPADPTAVTSDDGKYFDKDGVPTFKIGSDGTVDWYTYSGYRRYHSECHVCHGPDGEGSTYAPGLKNSAKTLTYPEFLNIVVNGRQNVGAGKESVMPALGLNVNVMCYIDDIYIYLRARAYDALGRVRPAKREPKPEAFDKAETACLGQ